MEKTSLSNSLPPKESSLFKRIVKCYDQKHYKTGLKFANQILSNAKYSEHGETLSMKGILLNSMGKKDEARELVKRGLRANLQSFVCWHIYGLIMKADRKYEEAIRCYLQALKLDQNNLQVLRDLSVLQMHTRDLEGCKETRNKLLNQRPNQRASWVGYAVIQHLLGSYDAAANIIYEFQKVETAVDPYNYEHSELLMYYITILMESNRYNDALSFMESHTKQIVDKLAYLEIHANLLLLLKRNVEAEEDVWNLLSRNPENSVYYELLYRSHSNDTNTRKRLLKQCMEKTPSARLPKLLYLDLLDGDEFLLTIDDFLRTNLRKGVPTLFVQVKRFYTSEEKVHALQKLYLQYRVNISENSTLGPISFNTLKFKHDDAIVEPPTTSLWLNYLISQHFSYINLVQEAINIVSAELENNPTIVELYVLKADIYRDAGDVVSASRWMEEAQSLDTADRFINAMCTKYMVQANRQNDAEIMASKFTRGSSTAAVYLSEMQCMWFLLENARTFFSVNKFGESLKLCHEIDRHYSTILEDQLDFHSYCLRKGTLRSYIETVRLENRLRDHSAYVDTAKLAIEIYLILHVNPLEEESESVDSSNANLSSSELKKARNKQRRAERRAEADAQRLKADQERREQGLRSKQNTNEKDSENDNKPPEVEELEAKTLARPKNALTEAVHFLVPLIDLSGNDIETHCFAFEVYEKKGKWLLMLRSIRRGFNLSCAPDNPWFNECTVRFLHLISKADDIADELVREVFLQEVRSVFSINKSSPIPNPIKYNENFMSRNASSFMHVFRGTLVKALLDPKSASIYLEQLAVPSADNLGPVTWKLLLEGLNLLKWYSKMKMITISDEFIDNFRNACSKLFPLASVFFSPTALEEHQIMAIKEANESSINGAYPKIGAGGDNEHTSPDREISASLQLTSISNESLLVNGSATESQSSIHNKTCKKSAKVKRIKAINGKVVL